MPSLRELQRGILRSLLEGEPQPDGRCDWEASRGCSNGYF